MISKPIQSRNVSTIDEQGQNYIVCNFCENIEKVMKNYDLLTNISNDISSSDDISSRIIPLSNTWEFAQYQNLGAQDYFYKTSIDSFIDNLLIGELKNTFWCRNCGSLSFSRIYASIINNSQMDIGFSVLQNESTVNYIDISLGKDFIVNFQGVPTNEVGKFFVYSDQTIEYKLLKISTIEANIVDENLNVIGNVKFNLANKVLTVSFGDKTDITVSKTISYVLALDFINSSITTANVAEFDIISATMTYNDGNVSSFTGCYVKSFNDK